VQALATLERQRRWRVLVYLLKAKIIATVEGLDDSEKSRAEATEGFAREMLPYLMLQDGSVVGGAQHDGLRSGATEWGRGYTAVAIDGKVRSENDRFQQKGGEKNL